MGRLITVSGPDGSGKSTQIAALEAHFEGIGLSCVTQWYRPGYSPLLDSLRAKVRKWRPEILPVHGAGNNKRADAFKRPYIRQLWLLSALVDSSIHYLGNMRWNLQCADIVIADRYLADAAMDLELLFPELQEISQKTLQLIRLAAPTPVIELLYFLPFDQALARCHAKNEPFADPRERRESRHRRYEKLTQQDNLTCIDASHPIGDVHQATLQALRDRGILEDAS